MLGRQPCTARDRLIQAHLELRQARSTLRLCQVLPPHQYAHIVRLSCDDLTAARERRAERGERQQPGEAAHPPSRCSRLPARHQRVVYGRKGGALRRASKRRTLASVGQRRKCSRRERSTPGSCFAAKRLLEQLCSAREPASSVQQAEHKPGRRLLSAELMRCATVSTCASNAALTPAHSGKDKGRTGVRAANRNVRMTSTIRDSD